MEMSNLTNFFLEERKLNHDVFVYQQERDGLDHISLENPTESQAKKKEKKKRERNCLPRHTAPQRPRLQTPPVFFSFFFFRLSPFILISSLSSAFVYSFGRASYLKIVFFSSSLFLDFSCVLDFHFIGTHFFVFLFLWPLNCHLAADTTNDILL